MIYCVNELDWSIQVNNGEEYLINLTPGDVIYTLDRFVNLIHVQSNGGWFWKSINKSEYLPDITMFVKKGDVYSNSTIYKRYDLGQLRHLNIVSDITKSVYRDIKLKSLGI